MAKKYQRRPSELAAEAWARGHMTPLELFRVAAWKTGQGLGSLAAKSGLLGLEGVGYSMATAVLDILAPDVWPVMDRWAVMSVFGLRPDGSLRPGSHWQHAAAYEGYARHLVQYGPAAWGRGLSVHQLDQKAMNLAKDGGALPPGWRYAQLPARR